MSFHREDLMYGVLYIRTPADIYAREFCEARGIEVTAYAANDGMWQIWVDMPDGTDFLRKKKWPDDQKLYAIYETYRSVTAKIQQNEREV